MFDFIRDLFKTKPNLVKILTDGALIIDVRSKGEYHAGHLKGSRNIPLEDVRKKLQDLKKLNKPLITVCRSGNRSRMAKSILTEAGIKVYNGVACTSLKGKTGN